MDRYHLGTKEKSGNYYERNIERSMRQELSPTPSPIKQLNTYQASPIKKKPEEIIQMTVNVLSPYNRLT